MRNTCSSLLLCILLVCGSASATTDSAGRRGMIVNDITQLNPVRVDTVIRPSTIEEIMEAVKSHEGPVSIGGGRYSMGGQTATERALQIDMRGFDSILAFSKEKREITVQTGIRWREIQEFIDPYDLSVKIMQSYANFTVGGSLSVNVHGRYLGMGPVILSVRSIRIVLPDGRLVTASREENPAIFYAAIGGYGGLGVIVEATLMLAENTRVERSDEKMPIRSYREYFFKKIKTDSAIIFHNADIYPDDYTDLRAVSYRKTEKPVTLEHRLKPQEDSYWLYQWVFWIITETPIGKWFREYIVDPLHYSSEEVVWRNYEASHAVEELEPSSREKSTYVLQEYFVPVEKFDLFVPKMAEILKHHDVNVVNISVRHSIQDPGSFLAWARSEVFAFVLYYKQGTGADDKKAVGAWTRELINAAVSFGGAYYLPYQIHATEEQFHAAYPHAEAFFALKKELDPGNKFRNKLWDTYYKAAPVPEGVAEQK